MCVCSHHHYTSSVAKKKSLLTINIHHLSQLLHLSNNYDMKSDDSKEFSSYVGIFFFSGVLTRNFQVWTLIVRRRDVYYNMITTFRGSMNLKLTLT